MKNTVLNIAYAMLLGCAALPTQACVIGTVFVDCNRNQTQDEGELGIAAVRLFFSNGGTVITDLAGDRKSVV